ncbi:YeaC family protein [Pseudomonas aeruginosa]|jgi:hypothetical protein|uniref:YeaC family protein n=1 Tax=Pseudomonas aeruginosa TaxID=287 RepID=UPI000B5A8895|nr:DUF1315 family protein [Pseudomonas aeruginosa]ASJ88892.1 hypothetical protein PSA83_06766 [Pseudomonas aeruginosa]HBO7832458.1 DUF1315 family protein [Pseudomonas aeruginosa]
MSGFIEVASTITAEVYASFKLAVEIGKWPDGRKLSLEQKELCLQAMIAYELKHLPEDQHTGFMGTQECKSKSMEVPNILFSSKADTLH